MAVKMRLQRKGRRKAPYYHIVVADARSPRDGKFIERLGFYNPMTKPATIEIDRDKAYDWLTKGAQPTETVNAILKFKGVLYKKHLMRGVKKGAFTLEEAEAKYTEYIQSKDQKVAARFEKTRQEQEERRKAIFGTAKIQAVEEPTEAQEEELAPAETDVAEETVQETLTENTVAEETVETPAVEDAPAAETEEAEQPSEAVVEAEIPATEEEAVEQTAAETETEVVAEEAPAADVSEDTQEMPEADTDSAEETSEEEEK